MQSLANDTPEKLHVFTIPKWDQFNTRLKQLGCSNCSDDVIININNLDQINIDNILKDINTDYENTDIIYLSSVRA